jgi:hypothetical protein
MATDLLPPGLSHSGPAPAGWVEPSLALYDAARVRKVRRALRVRAAQDSAIEAPFRDAQRAKFLGAGASSSVGAAGAAGASALGLVTTETSDTRIRNIREVIRLDVHAKRLKRMRTTVGHAARLIHFDAHTERHCQRWNLKFLTLTYAEPDAWEAGHFAAFRKAMREWCARRGVRLRYVWVAELQSRGALHYHVVVWLPKGKYLPRADSQGWWPHGATNIVTAHSPIGYITKYASKTTPDHLNRYPKGARMCGHGGLPAEGRRHIRYWNAPVWVRDALSGRADIRKVTGGYCDRITGEFLASPWRVHVSPGGVVYAYRIDDQPRELPE